MTPNEPLRATFGDVIENGWASENNPTRTGFFVREGVRTGRMNPGRYFEVTDGKGKFWELPVDKDHKITVRPALPPRPEPASEAHWPDIEEIVRQRGSDANDPFPSTPVAWLRGYQAAVADHKAGRAIGPAEADRAWAMEVARGLPRAPVVGEDVVERLLPEAQELLSLAESMGSNPFHRYGALVDAARAYAAARAAQLVRPCSIATLPSPSPAEAEAVERLKASVETFLAAYRTRYQKATGHVRDGAPMREEVLSLVSAFAAARAFASQEKEGG